MIELETIKGILEASGVECSVRTKRFKDPSFDYDYILCYRDNRYFETSVPCDNTVRMVTYRGGLMYTLNRMFSEFELRMACNINIVEYCVSEMLHRFIHDTNKHISYEKGKRDLGDHRRFLQIHGEQP